MGTPDNPLHPTGRRLRRRVRLLTIGIAGTAIMATVGVTAALAAERDDTASTASSSTSILSADDGSASTGSAASSSGTGTYSGSLNAPAQAPSATSGGGHSSSGGS